MRAEAVIAELRALESLRPVLDAVTALSGPYEGVYLVGGTVRDLLLGEPSFDVDIAVEGDAIELAEALAHALDGRVRTHRKFGTAAVFYGEQGRVDVVTARTESYEAPAVLPTVEHAGILDDLFRRDFTINAMAVSLRPDDLGRARRPVRRPRRPGREADARPPPALVRRRPDADLPRRSLREQARLQDGRRDGAARARLGRDGPRRRPLAGAAARGADRAVRRGSRRPHDRADRRARPGRGDPPAPRRRRRDGRAARPADGARRRVRARRAAVAARLRRPRAAAAARRGARLAPQPEAAPAGRRADRGRGHGRARGSPSR